MEQQWNQIKPQFYKAFCLGLLTLGCFSVLMAQSGTTDVAIALKTNLLLSEQLGMLGPVAISPYWGLFLASASSMLGLGNNEYLMTHPLLGNWIVFGLFLLIAIITSIPNITKYSKALGVAVNYLEDNTAIVVVVLTLFLQMVGTAIGETSPHGEFGFFGTSIYTVMLMAFSAFYMFVVTTVRLFFEIMAFVTPIPFVDTVTEILKKISSLVMMGVYFVSPEIALGISLILLVIAFFFFKKASTSLKYFKDFYISPILGWIMGKRRTVLDQGIAKKIKNKNIQYAIPVWPLESYGSIQKKKKTWLIKEEDGPAQLYQMKAITGSNIQEIEGEVNLKKEFNFLTIYADTTYPLKLRMSREFFNYKDEIVAAFDFNDENELIADQDKEPMAWMKKIKKYFSSKQVATDTEISA